MGRQGATPVTESSTDPVHTVSYAQNSRIRKSRHTLYVLARGEGRGARRSPVTRIRRLPVFDNARSAAAD